ncbi:MAG: tetratricopeptide repeat protein [Bacteroidetes bacterium]|nr:tetratricopeptide repeat protein [Bacteroidota bacterium]
MQEDFDNIFHDEENSELVNRYEEMLKNNTSYFFDVFEFENIIDFYIDSNKANSALDVVKYASQQHPSSLNIQLKKAQILLDKGQPIPALKIIEQIEKIESSNSDVYLLKGSTLSMMGRYSEAEKAFDTAIIYSYEDKVDIIHTVSQSFEQIGRYKTALKYLHQAYKMDTKNIMLLYDIAYCYEKMGKINKSVEFYRQYLDKEPFSENAWYNLGVLFNKYDRYDEAIEAFDFALAINPDFSVAYFNLANTLSNNQDYHNAILNYKEYIKFDGESVEVLTYLGDCYESLNEYDTALRYYDKALENDSYFGDAYFGKANIMFQLQKYELALQFIKKAAVLDDINAEYYYLQGNILSALKEDSEALKSYKKAYELDPDEQDFVFAISEAYAKSDHLKEAIATLTEFIKDNARNALANYHLASCYLKNKNEKLGLDMLKKGLNIDPQAFTAITLFNPKALDSKAVKELLIKYDIEF